MILHKRAAGVCTAGVSGPCAERCKFFASTCPIVAGNNVHDSTDRIRSVQRRTLRTANDFHAIDTIGIDLRENQRIRDFNTVDVNLG